jgi:hypothetical protein
MTPEEIAKLAYEKSQENIDRICEPLKKHNKELRRQLKWCHRVIGFMQFHIINFAFWVLLWYVLQKWLH